MIAKTSGIGLTAIAILLTAGCGGPGRQQGANPVNTGVPASLFSIPPNQKQHLQILTAEPQTITRSLHLTGTVAYNSFETTPVISPVGGPVSRIAAVPGQHVRKGEPLLYVASPDYSQLLANYLKARQAAGLAAKALARAEDLYLHHAIAQQDLEQTTTGNAEAQTDLAASESALKALGIADPETLLKKPLSLEVPVRAPIAGEVVEQNVSAGQLLQPGTTQCFLVSNTGAVWVLVNIYQKDLPYVHAGDTVTIETDAYPQKFHGLISYISAALDPATRTLQGRIVTRNPGDKLKKDMYVTVLVNAGAVKNAIAVPDSAVLRDSDNEPFVYIEYQDEKFGRRAVAVGESSDGKTRILSGLQPGDRYIANGALFLQFANSLQ